MCPPSDVPLFRRSRSCRPPLCSALALLRPRPPGLPNIPAFALGTIFTGIFYKNCVADANWLPGNRNMHVAGVAGSVALVTGIAAMLDTTTAISALGWIGGSLSLSRLDRWVSLSRLPIPLTVVPLPPYNHPRARSRLPCVPWRCSQAPAS